MMKKITINGADAEQLAVDIEQALLELEEFERECEWFSSQAAECLEYWLGRLDEETNTDDGV